MPRKYKQRAGRNNAAGRNKKDSNNMSRTFFETASKDEKKIDWAKLPQGRYSVKDDGEIVRLGDDGSSTNDLSFNKLIKALQALA
jgi:hypothetical protein